MAETPLSKNIVWHHGKLSEKRREEKLGHKGAVLWFTGLSGSGKSTVAREVELALIDNRVNAAVLDGDNVRHGLNSNLAFSPEDRRENIRRVGEVSKLFAQNNVVVLSAFISPYKVDREIARKLLPEGKFFEIYCAASIDLCESRDPKGLYKKARAGEISDFTGVSAPYEVPDNPDLILDTGKENLKQSTEKILRLLQEKEIIFL